MYSNTQNYKIAAITEKTLVTGIDIGSETHYVRPFNWRGSEFTRKPFIFNNDDEGFEAFRVWIEELKTDHGLDKVMPSMEPTGHYRFNLGAFLQDNGMRPVHVNLHHVKNRIARWFAIYFLNYKDVYGKLDALTGLAVLKVARYAIVENESGKHKGEHHISYRGRKGSDMCCMK